MKTMRRQGATLIFSSADRPTLLKGLLLATVVMFGSSGHVTAQDVDRDPFTPPAMSERIEVADEERIERITERLVRAEMALVEERISQKTQALVLESDQADVNSIDQIQAALAQRLDEVEARISSGDIGVSGPGGLPGASASGDEEAQSFMASLTFVACVNGRALYRDMQGSTFFSEVMDALESNSRCNS